MNVYIYKEDITDDILLSEGGSINRFSELSSGAGLSNQTTYWNALTGSAPWMAYTTTKEIVGFTIQLQLTTTATNSSVECAIGESSSNQGFSLRSSNRPYEGRYGVVAYNGFPENSIWTGTVTRNPVKFIGEKNSDGTRTVTAYEYTNSTWNSLKTRTFTPNTGTTPCKFIQFQTHSWTSAGTTYGKWIEVKLRVKPI